MVTALSPLAQGPLLSSVLEAARAAGRAGVVVFDLDSTLLDNRPRQARILRELGRERGIAALLTASPAHWVSWDIRTAMRNAGLSADEVQALYAVAREFWKQRFFTSEYCADDVPIRGAVPFVRALLEAGVQVAYVTGRHEGMRQGTLVSFQRAGFPEPPGPSGNVHLLMKPDLSVHDDDWKLEVQAQLRAMGELVAAFDNEPTHANGYRAAFPQATVVHLATDHSGRDVALLEGIVSIPHFEVE